MVIYKVTNLVSNKVYIGLTTQKLEYRKTHHLNDAKNQRYESCFHAAIRKYGKENFKWEIIRTAETKEQLINFEIEEIAKHQSNNLEFGYNLTKGGECLIGKDNPFYGKHHLEKTRRHWSKIRKGKNTGKSNYFYDMHFTGETNGFFGKIHKDSTKEIISNINSREFLVLTSEGIFFTIKNLHSFCKENNLVYHSVKLCSRAHKWYKKRYLIERI